LTPDQDREAKMANGQLRENLFRSHLDDLKDIAPAAQDVFVCPICLRKFSHDDLDKKVLTDGHVWPEEIRSRSGSAIAAEQRVLLCQHCNSMAGTRGDRQMQLREKIKEGHKTGQLYDERRIQLLLSPDERPIHLHAAVTTTTSADKLHAQLSFKPATNRTQWARNNPNEQQRFLRWADSGVACSVLIQPHHEHRHDLAKVGWVTSAYLLAFYTFGYRYIFHENLNPIREYILRSFEDTIPERLELPKSVTVGLHECTEHYFTDPEIALVVPLDGNSFVHLQVSILDYHIRLPFHFVQEALQTLVFSQPDIV
jgi:5-methylcytosine-specific restriction endonuclease McrA